MFKKLNVKNALKLLKVRKCASLLYCCSAQRLELFVPFWNFFFQSVALMQCTKAGTFSSLLELFLPI